jgi:hypothetical protein
MKMASTSTNLVQVCTKLEMNQSVEILLVMENAKTVVGVTLHLPVLTVTTIRIKENVCQEKDTHIFFIV